MSNSDFERFKILEESLFFDNKSPFFPLLEVRSNGCWSWRIVLILNEVIFHKKDLN